MPDRTVTFTASFPGGKKVDIDVSPHTLTGLEVGDVVRWEANGWGVKLHIKPKRFDKNVYTIPKDGYIETTFEGGPAPAHKFPYKNKDYDFEYRGEPHPKSRDTGGGENKGYGTP